MMKRLVLLCGALWCSLMLFALQPATHSLNIQVNLNRDGSAQITETWHVVVTSGTEWYTMVNNIGERQLRLIGVSENGVDFINEGEWNVKRSINEKANRCGVVTKRDNSYEICWGIGVYGEHTFVMTYQLNDLLEGYNDYDGFNYMFVARGIQPSPQQVVVTILAPDSLTFTPENTKIAGFGYHGNCNFYEGKVIAQSGQSFTKEDGIIVLMQCEKGLFTPNTNFDANFSDVVEEAMGDSDFKTANVENFEAEETFFDKIIHVLLFLAFGVPLLLIFLFIFSFKKLLLRKETGMKMADIPWSRDLPYGNDFFATFSLLTKIEQAEDNGIVSALMLRMVQNGAIQPHPTGRKDKVEFSFHAEHLTGNQQEKALFEMLHLASGSDGILQEKEFKKWSVRHAEEIYKWFEDTKILGENNLNNYVLKRSGNTRSKQEFKKVKQQAAAEAIGLKKFLEDTTLIDERRTVEVTLWRDYLIYASLFGIADKVAEELKQFQPQVIDMYEQQNFNQIDVVTMLNWSHLISNTVNRSVVRTANAMNSNGSGNWGGGGISSFGGGGGFSGGGFGGGSR
ncbi:MAG: DUF2207 domain-containing protein [Bacteroidales bacterium]|nr:DUF2207 domain-containing protein [Bacteroidales bacterium]